MPDAFKGAVIVVLLVIAFALYPAYRVAERSDDSTERAAHAALIEFADTVRGQGFVDVNTYTTFLHSLDASGAVFDVTLEYYKKEIQPVYTNPSDFTSFKNSFSVRYDGYFTKDILGILYPNSTLPDDDSTRRVNMHVGDIFNVRIETRGSTLASQIRSFLFHTHRTQIVDRYGGMVRSEAP